MSTRREYNHAHQTQVTKNIQQTTQQNIDTYETVCYVRQKYNKYQKN